MDLKVIIKCRLCLGEGDENDMYDLFKKESQSDNTLDGVWQRLSDRVEYCCGVRVRQSAEMPNKMCFRCYDMTRIWFKFRQMCINSQAYLESLCTDRSKTPKNVEFKEETDYLEYLIEDLQTFRTEARRSNAALAINLASSNKQSANSEDEMDGDFIQAVRMDNADSDSEFEEIMKKIKKEETDEEEGDMEMMEDEYPSDDGMLSGNEQNIELTEGIILEEVAESVESTLENPKKAGRGRPRLKLQNDTKDQKKKRSYYVSKKSFRPPTPTSYMCSICGNVYNKRASFNYHMAQHSETKPHECELCGRQFRQVCELKNHMRRHTGEKPFKCSYCDRHFIDRSEKHRHERIHTNERPYVCNVCGKSFTYSAILKNHVKMHSGEKEFKCHVCDKSFTLQHQLKAHLQTITHKQKEQQCVNSGYEIVYE